MSRPLYEIASQYTALTELPEDADVSAALAEIGGELEAKAVAIAYVLRNMEADEDALRAEELRLSDRRKADAARAEKLRNALQAAMQACGIQQVKHALFTITLRAGNGKVVVHDVDAVPDAYKHPPKPREVDKTAVKDAVKRGEAVPGCSVEYESSLQIR